MSYPIVLTVSQVNTYLKMQIEADKNLYNVYISGEISNFTNHYRTGHYYLTLKDDNSVIKAVMFRSNAQRLKFMPENGMKVIARGRISVYERDGQYQLYIDDMQPDGVGALHIAFEQLKEKLEKEGLFDNELKKPIPRFPERVGVITSPTGAAVKDIMNVLSRRFPAAEVVFCPVQVQGDSAPAQIIDAIGRFNRINAADVLIVGRGGGSIEELWAFNDENVARAVVSSEIPVISAVGHETDFTICDFAADLRAPTPSAAAELAVPDSFELKNYTFSLLKSMTNSVYQKINVEKIKLKNLTNNKFLSDPVSILDERKLILDSYCQSISSSMSNRLNFEKNRLSALCGKLDTLSPLKVLSRGYSITYNSGTLVRKTEDVAKGDNIKINVSDGCIDCTVSGIKKSRGGKT